jgi:predicted nucleic acid-binding protein
VNCYFDTSALIKNYVYEKGSEEVAAILDSADKVIVSPIAVIECASILSRMHVAGAYTGAEIRELLGDIEGHAASFDKVSFDYELQEASVRASFAHNLRSLDSIQLGAAILRKNEIHRFVSSDKKLLEAARKEKLSVEDPTA